MVNYLSKETEESLNNLIENIKNSYEYQKCLELQRKMQEDKELSKLIEQIKNTQKEYIKTGYQEKIAEKLKKLEDELNKNTTYLEYNYNLEKVNTKIEHIKDRLNTYFDEVTRMSDD